MHRTNRNNASRNRHAKGPLKKLVVFAHTPPPHHGQSLMVEQVLHGLGGDARAYGEPLSAETEITCYHVNCRVSDSFEEIGTVRLRKILLILKYCAQAIWCRLRYGVGHLFYVPAPPLRSAIYRDWIVMAICRPFFRTRIFYWQAAGLGEWLACEAKGWERTITKLLLGRPALSIVLADYNRRDAHELESKVIQVIPNFIPDPCPEFERDVAPTRLARQAIRRKTASRETLTRTEVLAGNEAPHLYRVLFVGLCSRSKGLFDAIEAVAEVNKTLAQRNSSSRVQLEVAGAFWRESEQREFEQRIRQSDLVASRVGRRIGSGATSSEGESFVRYHGFVSGAQKRKLLIESDCFCFPTCYPAESFGLVLLEAMAFDLPIITTSWRMIPEILPKDYPGIVSPQSPALIASAILTFMSAPPTLDLRAYFLTRFTDTTGLDRIRMVLGNVIAQADS